MFSLAGTLDAMRPHLPGALVSADAFEHARTAVDHLEAEITNGIYFECRLRNGSSRVDLVIAVHADGAALLADANGSGPRGCRHAQPGGRRLSAFCRRWTTPTSPLRTLVDHLWLEYDVEQGGFADEAARSGPGVFCSLRGSHGLAHPAPALRHSVIEALEALTGHQTTRTVQECLHTCFARLPAEAAVPHVGLMFGRDAPTVRICIAKLPAAGVSDLLAATARVGGGDLAEITRLASLPDGRGGPLYVPMLHLDIDERRGFVPRVGMERQFAHACQLTGRTGAGERHLLDTLTALGLCSREKRDALLKWPGRALALLPHEVWWSVVERRVNHVKFVYEPHSGVETKGYLFARHRPHRGNSRPKSPTGTHRKQPSNSNCW
ncbi:MAG: hypothetical protein F4018_02765 [Acidobacteria bacterium]|nr:hypothetical protein [Acidobacteriota bacterium]MYH30166.1 hypothetical protein [Acidobacteriota bacterium]MYK87341.1 hypothetical protein [Acidobacteriota bacterium]